MGLRLNVMFSVMHSITGPTAWHHSSKAVLLAWPTQDIFRPNCISILQASRTLLAGFVPHELMRIESWLDRMHGMSYTCTGYSLWNCSSTF